MRLTLGPRQLMALQLNSHQSLIPLNLSMHPTRPTCKKSSEPYFITLGLSTRPFSWLSALWPRHSQLQPTRPFTLPNIYLTTVPLTHTLRYGFGLATCVYTFIVTRHTFPSRKPVRVLQVTFSSAVDPTIPMLLPLRLLRTLQIMAPYA
jgi:hypothetical protein